MLRLQQDATCFSPRSRYRNVRNLADAIVIFETQWRTRYGVDCPMQSILEDARFILNELKAKVFYLFNTAGEDPFPLQLSSRRKPGTY